MISYKFNKETGFVETVFKGEISISDIVNYILKLKDEKTFPEKLKILSDASEGKFTENVTPDDLTEIVEANKLALAVRDKIYDAFIISSSLETALGHLYQELSKVDNYKFKIFSTEKAAFKWLDNMS